MNKHLQLAQKIIAPSPETTFCCGPQVEPAFRGIQNVSLFLIFIVLPVVVVKLVNNSDKKHFIRQFINTSLLSGFSSLGIFALLLFLGAKLDFPGAALSILIAFFVLPFALSFWFTKKLAPQFKSVSWYISTGYFVYLLLIIAITQIFIWNQK